MLAHRYKSRKKLMLHTLNTSAKTACQIICAIFINFFFWSIMFGGENIDIDFHTLCIYFLYFVKLYADIYGLTILVSVFLINQNSGVCFVAAFIISFAVFITDILTQNVAIICLDYSLINSVLGLLTDIFVIVILAFILKRQIYKAEI